MPSPTEEVKQRRAVVRRLLIAGKSRSEIIDLLSLPFAEAGSGTVLLPATVAQVEHDLRAIGHDVVARLKDPEGIEDELCSMILQAQGLVDKARDAGEVSPAVAALKLKMMLIGLRQPALDWRDRRSSTAGAKADAAGVERARRLEIVSEMSDEDLVREMAERRVRMDRLARVRGGNAPTGA